MTKENEQPKGEKQPERLAIEFLQDYRGVLTGEQFYLAETRVEFPAEQARELVAAGRAVLVKGK
jgi:hypothetical protein